MVDPVEDAMVSGLTPAVPTRERVDTGEEVPIPTFPFARMEKSEVPVEDATENGLSDPVPWIENFELFTDAVEVPIAIYDEAMIDEDVELTPLP